MPGVQQAIGRMRSLGASAGPAWVPATAPRVLLDAASLPPVARAQGHPFHRLPVRAPSSPAGPRLLPLPRPAGEEHQDEPYHRGAPRLPALHQEVPAVGARGRRDPSRHTPRACASPLLVCPPAVVIRLRVRLTDPPPTCCAAGNLPSPCLAANPPGTVAPAGSASAPQQCLC